VAKFGIVLGGVLLGFLVGEAGVAWLAPQLYRRASVWQFESALGWSHIPGAVGRMVTPEFSVDYRINNAGLRDREYTKEKPPGTERLLVFGDSFVEGWGVEAEQTVAKRLEQRLGRQRSVEVINFGVAGYGTDQEWLYFEQTGVEYQPDRVLVLFYGNDLWNNNAKKGIGAEKGYKPYFRPDQAGRLKLRGTPVRKTLFWDKDRMRQRPWPNRLEQYFYEHWHLFVLAHKAFTPPMPRQQQQTFYQGLYGLNMDEGLNRVWRLSGDLLAGFNASVRQAGAEMLLVYIPSIVQIVDADWQTKRQLNGLIEEYNLLKPNQQLAAFAKTHQIPFLDLYPAFKEIPKNKDLYFSDSHWTPAGHDLAAAQIEKILRQDHKPIDGSRL
jgi:lysophospholipase L1-like esterase